MGKVVHVSDDLHARAKAYCQEQGLDLKSWVSGLILEAVGATKAPAPKVDAVPVEKKPQTQLTGDQSGEQSEPWRQPPFWKDGKAS